MLKNKSLLAIAAAAVIIVVAIVAGVGIFMNRPETVMQTSVQGLLTEVFEREEFETAADVLMSGSAELIMSMSNAEDEASLEYKEYFGLKNKETYIEKLKFTVNDYSVDGSFYAGEDYMYVSVPALYEDAIGIVRGRSDKNFGTSVFAYGSGGEYELPEETSDAIKVFCRIYDDALDKKAVADIEALLKSYVELIMDSVAEHADIKKDSETVKINGDQVGARVITVEIDAECIYNVMDDLCTKLEKDKDIPKLIKKYSKLIDEYTEGTSLEGKLQTELGEDEDDELVDAVLEAYDTALDEFRDALDEMEDSLDELSGSKIIVKLATKKTSSELMAFTVSVKESGSKTELLDVQIGKSGIKKTNKLKVTVAGETTVKFTVKQDDKKAYKAELTVEQDAVELAKYYVKIDKEGESFELGASDGSEQYAIEGDYTKKGKAHTFDLKDVVYTDSTGKETSMIDVWLDTEGNENIEFKLTLIIREKDKPKPIAKGKVVSAFELSEEELEKIKTAAEEVGTKLSEAFGLGTIIPDIEVPDIEVPDYGFDW